jgi:hypothetical protein
MVLLGHDHGTQDAFRDIGGTGYEQKIFAWHGIFLKGDGDD